MHTEEALIFYEGLRPIRCRKIRYYADPRFRARLLPPPACPAPQRAAEQPLAEQGDPYIVNAPPTAAAAVTHTGANTQDPPMSTREATLADIDRIDQLTLEDFAADFSNVPFPQDPGPLSDTQMTDLANAFIDSLRSP
jgi:type IV secretion system protein VirD4